MSREQGMTDNKKRIKNLVGWVHNDWFLHHTPNGIIEHAKIVYPNAAWINFYNLKPNVKVRITIEEI